MVAVVAVALVPREVCENTLTCVAAYGRVKISTVSAVLLCAVAIMCSSIHHFPIDAASSSDSDLQSSSGLQ